MKEIIERALATIEEEGYDTFGLRFSRTALENSQKLDNSRECWCEANLPDWLDHEELEEVKLDGETYYFGQELDGTCAVGIEGLIAEEVLSLAEELTYEGKYAAIIAGDYSSSYAADEGEVIVRNAVVMATWER